MTNIDVATAALLDDPHDASARAGLGDALEEAGDPRAELLRLVPRLLAVPKRTEPRLDVSVAVWRGNSMHGYGDHLRSNRQHWPRLPVPLPMGLTYATGQRRAIYRRGYHQLGRLLALAMLLEHPRWWVPKPEIAIRWELWNCSLIGAKERDSAGCSHGGGVRHHIFSCYLNMAEDVVASVPGPIFSERDHEAYFREIVRRRAVAWSRCLDMCEEFCRVVPWEAARLAWRIVHPEKVRMRWGVGG